MYITDPIYGPISIRDRDILRLIDTKAFQRLANIKQQGHTYFYMRTQCIRGRTFDRCICASK